MLRSIRRALTLAAAVPVSVTALFAGAPVASADPVPYPCDQALSTRLFTGEVAEIPFYVWVQQVSSTETRVCFGAFPNDIVVIVKSGVSLTPPAVGQTSGTGSCSIEVVDVVDPVPFQVSLGAGTQPTLCLGLDHETTTLSLTGVAVGTLPDVDVWRAEGGLLFCWVEWVQWQQAGGTQSGSAWSRYVNCQDGPDRIL